MIKFGNKVVTYNNKWAKYDGVTPLQPFTIRLKYKQGITPSFNYGTGVLYDAEQNIWDLTYEHNDWSNLLYNNRKDLLEVIEANTEGVVNMDSMFYECNSLISVCMLDTSNVTNMNLMFSDCKSLTTIPLFNTSKVTNMGNMFTNCRALTSIPLFDTSNVTDTRNMFSDCRALTSIPLFNTSSLTNMPSMFYNCYNVQSGALALYTQASSQTMPPSNYWAAFRNCGRDTTTGAAELAQIPSDWK